MRNRLIELLEEENGFSRYITADERRERIADHLIANGVVIIDPVKYPPVTNRGIIDQVMETPLDEVADLIRAKQEERIIVPPCKIGDLLFCIISGKSCDKVYHHIEACRVNEVMYFGRDSFLYGVREINNEYEHNVTLGESAFRKFEEAEKALAGRRGS